LNTIMLVEDDRQIGRLMKMLFELEGYRVVATNDYEEVLPLLREALPNILLMDVHVQGQHTIDLVRQMRQSGENVAHIPVVMTSAMDCRRECIEAGADQFILKPFLPDEVVEEVTDLSRQQQLRATYDVSSGLAFQ
jgi:DNA-binding response OmpR family regulator